MSSWVEGPPPLREGTYWIEYRGQPLLARIYFTLEHQAESFEANADPNLTPTRWAIVCAAVGARPMSLLDIRITRHAELHPPSS